MKRGSLLFGLVIVVDLVLLGLLVLATVSLFQHLHFTG